MQYYSLQHWTLLSPVDVSTTKSHFYFGPASSFFLELFLHSSLVAYWTLTDLGGSSYGVIFLPFHIVHGILEARILKWFAISFSSGPHIVRTLHHDLSILGGPTQHGSCSFIVVIKCGKLLATISSSIFSVPSHLSGTSVIHVLVCLRLSQFTDAYVLFYSSFSVFHFGYFHISMPLSQFSLLYCLASGPVTSW